VIAPRCFGNSVKAAYSYVRTMCFDNGHLMGYHISHQEKRDGLHISHILGT